MVQTRGILFAFIACLGCDLLMPAVAQAANEQDKIEWLIGRIGVLEGAKFIRNGTDYDAKAAATHLRRKWKAVGDEIKTVEDFIEKIASKSSRSGEAYRIKFADGKEVNCGEWMREELKKYEEPAK